MYRIKILSLLKLFRFELPFTAGVCVLLGELLALGTVPPAKEMMLGFLSVFFISATALILNDYFDIETDRINAPERPLPSGLVTKQEVLLLSLLVTFLGLTAAYLISNQALLTVGIVWFVGFLYNWKFKKSGLPGNLMVGFSVGMTFVFGGIAVGKPFELLVWFFAVWVMMIDLAEEIAADALDVDGDRISGSRSIAVLYGSDTAMKISAAIFSAVIVFSTIPFWMNWLPWEFAIPFILTDSAILYSIPRLLDSKRENRLKFIRLIYLSGLISLLLLILIRLLG